MTSVGDLFSQAYQTTTDKLSDKSKSTTLGFQDYELSSKSLTRGENYVRVLGEQIQEWHECQGQSRRGLSSQLNLSTEMSMF